MNEVVPAALDGERVDRLVSMLCGVSRAAAATLIQERAVQLDGEVVIGGKQRVRAGQIARRSTEDDGGGTARRRTGRLGGRAGGLRRRARHRGGQARRPGGPPGRRQRDGTLVNGLLARYPEIGGVGPTPSGPGSCTGSTPAPPASLVVARTDAAYAVAGAPAGGAHRQPASTSRWCGACPRPAAVWSTPRSAARRGIPRGWPSSPTGRPARTAYEVGAVVDARPRSALLRCRLETGRTHQIRVHLAAIGHPVVGDDRYGGVRAGLDAARPMLHAVALAFDHPARHERVRFTSPVPADMQRPRHRR